MFRAILDTNDFVYTNDQDGFEFRIQHMEDGQGAVLETVINGQERHVFLDEHTFSLMQLWFSQQEPVALADIVQSDTNLEVYYGKECVHAPR